jgi:tRNA threonylcarbamoyl adenosine modification protein YeaZ
MPLSIIVQNTYTTTRVGLYQNFYCVDRIEDVAHASSSFIPALNTLLAKHTTALADLSFIGAYQGPGPFTTLRIILASINGIACAQNIPLVGIDGLDAFLEECTDEHYPCTIALLNAYNNDAYFGIEYGGVIIEKGYKNISELLADIQQKFPHKEVRFIGQGVPLFKEIITTALKEKAYFPSPLPEAPSLDFLARKGYQLREEKKMVQQLLPLYLKTLHYKKSIY